MAGIGEYVHYRFKNYQRFGLGYNTVGSKSAAAALVSARQDLKMLNKYTVSTIQTQEIEKFLNDLTYSNADVSLKNLSLTAGEIEQHKTHFVSLIQAKIPELEKVLGSLNLGGTSSGTGNIGGLSKINLNNKLGVTSATVGKAQMDLMSLMNSLQAQRSSFEKGSASRLELNKILLEAKRLYIKLGQLTSDLSRQVISYDQTIRNTDFSAKALFVQYNELIKLASQPTMKQYGDIAELFFQYMVSAASGMSQAQLDDLVAPLTAGSHRVATIGIPNISTLVNIDSVIEGLNKSKTSGITSNKWTSSRNNGYTVNLTQNGSTSQQTVDIVIDFSNNKNAMAAFGIDKLRASVKNVKGLSNIHILSEAPLSSAFALFDTNFVNHYLNLIATHPDGNGGAFVDKYNETIEMGLALRALSGIRDRGNVLGVDISDCLIVNNKGKGVRVVDTSTLMNCIYSNLRDYVRATGMPTSIGQDWVGYASKPSTDNAYARIGKLIAATHAFKISLTLKKLP